MKRALALTIILAISLSACAASERSATPPSSTPEGSPASTPAPSDDSSIPCSSEATAAIEQNIKGQANALKSGEFDKAYNFTSANFRASTTRETFSAIITNQFPMLLKFTSLDFWGCTVDYKGYNQLITVNDATGSYKMRYLMSVVEDVLGIESAEIVEPGSSINS